MHHVSRDRSDCAEIQGETIAQKLIRDRDPFRSQSLEIFPSIPKVRDQEKEKERATDHAVFREQMQIIIMRVDRIVLHPFGAKHSAEIEIGAASSAEEWRRFPFFGRSVPEIEPDRRGAKRIVGAVSEVIALLNK